jgi:beta-phosphoglucomutase-like phosphatase (HAD superfamily)
LYRAVLFDLDGTLADTDSPHPPAWVDVLRPHGVEIDERFFRENISGRSNSKIVEDLSPHLSAEDGRDLAHCKEERFRERVHELEPLPGLLDLPGAEPEAVSSVRLRW